MLGLWTDSIVGAGMILLMVGYGENHWLRWRLKPSPITGAAAILVFLGGIVPPIHFKTASFSVSLLVFGALVVGLGFWKGEPSWWLWWLSLGAVMTLVRTLMPMNPHRAQLVGTLGPESLALGIAGGVLTEDPVAGLMVAMGADILSSVWVGFMRPGTWQLGGHDLTSALLAALAGYLVGWVGYQWHRWRTTA